MLISIIVPVYNAEKFIHKCVDSISSQTYTDYELILVDDGSTDNSAVICDTYAQNNGKIKVIHQKNSGPGPSRNNGLAHATGDYILFVDSDDYIYDCTLETLVKCAQGNNYPDAILFDYIMGNDEYNIKRSTLPKTKHGFLDTKSAILNSAGSTWCKMYKARIIKENAVMFPALPRKEDFVFNKAALSYCKTVFYVKEHLYFYFNNINSIVHTTTFSKENQKAAFCSLRSQMAPQYLELVHTLTINNYLISAVQDMCFNGVSQKEIKKLIVEYECDSPNWFANSKDLILSKESKVYLFLIYKRQTAVLKCVFWLRSKLKQ
jgi:glycosyltransferase involved in cell wall biosynthesis